MATNEKHPRAAKAEPAPAGEKEGERIAKVLSRRGIASRRDAERLIAEGLVTVNGKVIDSPALNVTDRDRITVSGQPLPDLEPPRLWLYYKPEGLVTSTSDEKGRDTVFDHLPEDMPRVMSIGRLDLNSEGLLLLTNDGELKRRLELPSTGWLRKYRVRVNGTPDDVKLQPLRDGITVDGERFQGMQVTLDRVQGANAWLTVGLREGKNREIRRALNAVGLYVNRLIRVSYGPFRLGELEPGQVEEVRQRVLKDQLGETEEAEVKPARTTVRHSSSRSSERPAPRGAAKPGEKPAAKPAPRSAAPAKPFAKPGAKPFARRPAGEETARPSAKPGAKPSSPTGLPRPAKPGDGVRTLAKAWKTAVTPRLDAEGGKARDEAKPFARPKKKAPPTQSTRNAAPAAPSKPSPRGGAKPGGAPRGTGPRKG